MTITVEAPAGVAIRRADPGSGARVGGIEVVQLLVGQRRQRWSVPRSLQRLLGPILLLALWQLASAVGWLNPDTLPSPAAVARAAGDLLADGELQSHLWTSAGRVVKGTMLGLVVGLALALAAGLSKIGDNLIDSNMEILRAIPNFALLPVLIIWLGINEEPKVLLIALSVIVAIYINTYAAIRQIDGGLVEAARTFGLRRWGMIRWVVLPGMVPGFLVGLRLALTASWLALIFAETVNARQGIGRLMSDARERFQLDVIFVILAVYAVLGLLCVSLVRFLEKHLLTWKRSFDG